MRSSRGDLEKIEHPLVRELALSKLQEGTDEESVIGLFIKNYQVDDERRILEAVEVPVDESERHGMMMDVVKVLEANPERRLFTTGGHRLRFHSRARIAGSTPPGSCSQRQVAPEWLTNECRYDSGEDCRGLVEKAEIRRGRSE